MKKIVWHKTTAGIVSILVVMLMASTTIADAGFADWLKRDSEAQQDFRQGKKSPDKTLPKKVEESPTRSQERFSPTPPPASITAGSESKDGWLVMVYVAGDNNLDPYALTDIKEMQEVGSSENLKIAVLMDRVDYGDWSTARQFLVRKPKDQGGKDSWDDSLSTCEDLGELNMGDPKTLTDFVKWATATYPQKNTMLILWNHGGGWRSAVSKAISAGATRSSGQPPKEGLSRLSRGIAWDDTNNGDFLEMREVRSALEPFPPFTIIGADACLMAMVEVAYELRERCDYFIGSENNEPGDGWPYHKWLPALARNSAMEPEKLCKTIVDEYTKSYGAKPTTLSAVRQSDIPALAKSIDSLACALIDHSEAGAKPLINFEGLPVYSPDSRDFVDLGAFLDLLQSDYPKKIKSAAKDAKASLKKAVVISNSHKKLGGQGLSIYPGGGNDDRDYRAGIIQFARDTRWDEMLRELTYHSKAEARSKLSSGTPDRWAVLIGVEDYADTKVASLNYSVDDIEKLREVLIKHAGYKAENIKLLKNSEATAANVRSTLGTWLPRQVSDEDMVLIYFSGHGGAEPSIRGDVKDGTEKYMMLSDSKVDDMYGTAIPMSELAKIFGRIRADKLLFAMDSCYSGATGKGVMREGMKAIGLRDDYLNALTGSSGTVVLTASRASEVSMESKKLSMGIFSHFLCQALTGLADSDSDGLVSVVELFQFVNTMVPKTAKQMGSSQHPVMKGEISGTFPIAVVNPEGEGGE